MRIKLMQSWPIRFITEYFKPRSNHPGDAFRERAIRVVMLIAFVFFFATLCLSLLTSSLPKLTWIETLTWYGFTFALIAFILLSLRAGNVRLAGRLMMLSVMIIVIDPSRAFWSPGTVVFGLLFTFVFELVLDSTRDITLAIVLNLGLYTWIALTATDPAPLRPDDYFSDPFAALITVYTTHLIIIGVAYFIRREQQERDRMELLLEQHQVDVLRQFLGHTSHDLRTALTKIRLPLYRLGRSTAAEDQPALDSLTRAVGELETLLLTMIEMSQLDDVSRFIVTTVDAQRLLSDVIRQITPNLEQKHQTLTILTASVPLMVQANAEYLARAINNVLDNAIKFTQEEGVLTITTKIENEQAVITITDTGSGIEPDKLPYIFDRFFRGDEARTQSIGKTGMGLGLSIAKKIIELHGGTIRIASTPGKGTTCTIRLPVAKTKPLLVPPGNRVKVE